jgi:transposase
MERRKRRNFTQAFKAEAVRLVREGRKSLLQVARDLNLTGSTLRNWVRKADRGDGHQSAGDSRRPQRLYTYHKAVKVLDIRQEWDESHDYRWYITLPLRRPGAELAVLMMNPSWTDPGRCDRTVWNVAGAAVPEIATAAILLGSLYRRNVRQTAGPFAKGDFGFEASQRSAEAVVPPLPKDWICSNG